MSHIPSFANGSSGVLDALRVSSLSHRTCGLTALGGVIAHGDAARVHATLASSGIPSIVLSTCNRFEVYWHAADRDDDRTVEAVLDATVPSAKELLRTGGVHLSGEDAAQHLFRVCSGLESVVLGEAEILGQARSAMEQAAGSGAFLQGVFTAAIRTGRAARAETGIAHGAMSVASVAVRELRKHLTLRDSRVLVIGAGETAAKVTRHVAAVGVASLVITNRTHARAHDLAAANGGKAVSLDTLAAEIAQADAVVCAASSEHWLVTRAMVGDRAAKTIVLVDIAMPPAVERFAAAGVVRIDLAAIEHATAEHRRRREGEIPKVDALIARELEWLRVWAQRKMSPRAEGGIALVRRGAEGAIGPVRRSPEGVGG